MDLDSPIFRFAAATGEDPQDVQAAIECLRVDGWSVDRIWKLLEASIDAHEPFVDVAARALDVKDPRYSPKPTRRDKAQRRRTRNARGRKRRR